MAWYYVLTIVIGSLFFFCLLMGLILNISIFRRRKNYFDNLPVPRGLSSNLRDFNDLKKTELDYLKPTNFKKIAMDYGKKVSKADFFETPSDYLVVILHGYQNRKEDFTFMSKHYHQIKKYNVLAIDLLGHGETTGQRVNFGYEDSKLVISWIDKMISEKKQYKIIIHGFSMGAYTTLRVAQENHPNVIGVFADSPYRSLKELFYSFLPRTIHFFAFPLILSVSFWNVLIQGVPLGKITLDRLEQISVPVHIVHGELDTLINPVFSHNVYEKVQSSKKYTIMKRSGHVCGFLFDHHHYINAIEQLLEMIDKNEN